MPLTYKAFIESLGCPKRCTLCGCMYEEEHNLGRWLCTYHPGKWSSGKWTCCSRQHPSKSLYGCTPCDHLPRGPVWNERDVLFGIPVAWTRLLEPSTEAIVQDPRHSRWVGIQRTSNYSRVRIKGSS